MNVDNTKDDCKYNHVSLCAGYGGIDIGLQRILPNIRTICSVEIEAYAIANLIEKMETRQMVSHPVWTNLKTFDARKFCGCVDILSGGFPCQPFSKAGKRKGTEDERHLFPEIERIISECKPSVVFLENVQGIISSKLHGTEQSVLHYVLQGLEKLGYKVTAGTFSAEECGYPHQRKRVFIAGIRNTNCKSKSTLPKHDEAQGMQEYFSNTKKSHGKKTVKLDNSRCNKCGGWHTVGKKQKTNGRTASEGKAGCCQRQNEAGQRTKPEPCNEGTKSVARPNEQQHGWEYPRTIGNEKIIATMDGTTHGIANGNILHSVRVDALRLLGNGVVPATAAKAFVFLINELNETN